MSEKFYSILFAFEQLRHLRKDLQLKMLTNADLLLHKEKEFRLLLEYLYDALNCIEFDPRLLQLVTEVQGLEEFFTVLKQAYSKEVLNMTGNNEKEMRFRAIEQIDGIMQQLGMWNSLAQKMLGPGNLHIKELGNHPKFPHDRFFVFVKELAPQNLKVLHPYHPDQVRAQMARETKDLLAFDEKDPLSGYRLYWDSRETHSTGPRIAVKNGHHRLFEIYRRYLAGLIDGNEQVEFAYASK